jgi:hypothetical protein
VGKIIAVGFLSQVQFEAGELTVNADELRTNEDVPSVNRTDDGIAGMDSVLKRPTAKPPVWIPIAPAGSMVTYPSRPELGAGIILSLTPVYTIQFASGVKTQPIREVRSASQ